MSYLQCWDVNNLCFPIKVLKSSDNTADIDADLITVNNFFAHWVKEISITKYGSNKEPPPTFLPWEVYQYSDEMFKHLPTDSLKTIQKTHLYSKEPYFASTLFEGRDHNSTGVVLTELNAEKQKERKKKTRQKSKYRRKNNIV